jgi:ribosomal protein S18 acetylase RimI-like enzyme
MGSRIISMGKKGRFGKYGEIKRFDRLRRAKTAALETNRMYETTVTIVACIDGIPVGFAMIGDPFSRYDLRQLTELLAIAVDPEKQRKGIGGLLLSEAEKKATELGIRRIFLHTATGNLPARRLFTQAGYRPWEIKRSFYPKGQDAIAMLKNL